MEFVQVNKASLLEYIAYVERLSHDHTQLAESQRTAISLADIVRNDYEARIDKLLDLILDQPIRDNYYRGLSDAYKVMKSRYISKQKN